MSKARTNQWKPWLIFAIALAGMMGVLIGHSFKHFTAAAAILFALLSFDRAPQSDRAT